MSLTRLNHPTQTSSLLILADTAADRYRPVDTEPVLGFRTCQEITYPVPAVKVDSPTVITSVPEFRVQTAELLREGVQLPANRTLELSGVSVPVRPDIEILVLLRSVTFVVNVTEIVLSLQG